MSEKKSMKGMKWIIVLLAVFLVAGAFVGAAGAGEVTASFTTSPESGNAPLEVTFTATASTTATEPTLTYSWNFKDGSTAESGTDKSTVTHTFSTAGTYAVELTVTDSDNASKNATKSIAVSQVVKTYTVTFNAGADVTVTPASKTVTAGETYGTLPTPTKTGFTFDGWFTDETSGSKIEATTPVTITANQTLYAHWTAKATYTVTFSAGTGINVDPASKTVTAGEPYGTLPTPTKTGFIFDGWFTGETSGSKIESTTPVTITDNQTLYAHWTAQTQEITSITVAGITAPALGNKITVPTSLTVSATNPDGYKDKLHATWSKWTKVGVADPSAGDDITEGTYVAEFTITADTGVTIKNNATVIAGSKNGTYSGSSGKATISYTLGKTEISSIGVSLTTPAGGSAAPAITLTDTANLRMGNDLKWYKGTSDTALASNATLEYNTEYRAVFTVLIADDDTHKFASTVSVSGPDCVLSTSSVVKDSVTPDSRVTVTLKFKTAVDKEIDTVSLTMNAPSAGSTVSNSTSLVTAESNAKYSVNSLRWYSGTKELTTSDKFEYGTKYTAKIVLKTTDDYVFNSGIKKSDVKVNSNTVDKDPSLTDSSKTLTLEYTFTEAAKPTVTLTANPSSPKIGVGQTSVAVQFSYTITGNYGSATINFGDGSAASTLSSKSGTASHTYTGTGPYTVTITVKDASGVLLSNGKLNITVGKDTLTAGFTATPASDNPQKISFTGTTSGTVSKWEWDLGDGTKMNEKSFTHTYKKAGDYTVTLTVYSGELSDTTSKTLTVVKGTGDDEPFLIIGDTEVPSPLDIIAEFVRLLLSLFNFEEHPLFPDFGE